MPLKLDKSLIFLFLIILVAFILRIIFLNQIPPAIANDEINIIINAQSFLKTGQNIPGVVTGIFGNPTGDLSGGVHSEISSYILIPWLLILGFSWPLVKIPFVFFSMGIIIYSFLIVKKLINKEAGLLVAFLSAVNPWTIFFGRSAYESVISSFFYLLAIYLVISLKSWRLLWALPVFIIASFTYFSAKTLFLPIILVTLITMNFFTKESKKPAITFALIAVTFLIIYLPILKNTPAGNRFGELNNSELSEVVDTNRKQSLNFPFSNVFENKLTVDLQKRLNASLGTFSPTYLFLNGQPESIPSLNIPTHAFMYFIDLPLIIFGLIYLSRKNLKALYLFLGLLLTTLIPNFLNLAGTTYSIRTVILFPVLTMLSGIGIYSVKEFLFKKIYGKIIFGILVIVYLLFVGNFLFHYFSRLTIDKNEGWFLPNRLAFKYIDSAKDSNIYFATSEPKHTFYRYLLFSNQYQNSSDIKKINQDIQNKNYSLGNVKITGDCPEISKDNTDTIFIVDVNLKCSIADGNQITSIKDAGTKYTIVNDKVCEQFINKRYPHIKDIDLLNIEGLSIQDFCQNYITNPDKFSQ